MKRRSPFGELVRQYRRHLGLSQEGLAHRINTLVEAGNAGIEGRISAKTIYNHEAEWEDATHFAVPRVGTIGVYADAFGLKHGTAARQAFIDAAEATRRLRDAPLPHLEPPVTLPDETGAALSPAFVIAGREQPWAALRHALDAALAGHPRVVLLEGDPGIGKTRLLAELGRQAEDADERAVVVWGRCIAPVPAPYHAMREVLRLLIGDLAGAGVSQLVSPTTGARLHARAPEAMEALFRAGPAIIGSLIDTETLRAQAAALHLNDDHWRARFDRLPAASSAVNPGTLHSQIAGTLTRYAASGPVILVVDDLHWATSGTLHSLALLAHLLQDATRLPFLLAGAWRPGEMNGSESPDMRLAPLLAAVQRGWPDGIVDLAASASPAHGRAYIAGRLDLTPNRLDAAFRETLFTRTGGLPLFVENALWTLQTSGQVRRDDHGALTLHGSLADLDLSSSTRAIIGQRLDGLDPTAREALEIASVQGEQFFADPVIARMALAAPEAARLFDTVLVKRARLIVPAGAITVAGVRLHRYQFAHALYHDFLASQLGALRREQHQAATAAALEALVGAAPTELSATIANLHEQAGAGAAAARQHRLAGTWDLDTLNPASARGHFERAIALADRRTQAEEIGQAMLGIVRGLRMTGDSRRAIIECQRTLTFSRANHLPGIEVFTLIWQGLVLYDLGELRTSEAKFQMALPLLRALGDAREECRAEGLLAHVLYSRGRYEESLAHAARSLELAEEAGDDQLAAESRLSAANCLLDLGRYEDAIATFEDGIVRYQRARDLRGEAMCRADIGLCLVGLQRWPQADRAIQDAHALAHRLAAMRILGHVELYQGLVSQGRGDWAGAGASYARSLRLRRQNSQPGFAVDALAGLLRVATATGHPWRAHRLAWGIGQYLGAHGAEGIEEPFRVAESCVAALDWLGEPVLADHFVRESVALLQERAALLTDGASRESYLRGVAANRALLARARRLSDNAPTGTA